MAATTYLDEHGRPILRESVAAFLDVLGFSHNVLEAAKSSRSQQYLDRISDALQVARPKVRASGHDGDKEQRDVTPGRSATR